MLEYTFDLSLSNSFLWLAWSFIVFITTFNIDQVDHGIFIGLPAFIMVFIAPWIVPNIFNLLIYAVGMALFYSFCQRHRDWFHGTKKDINDG